MSRKYIVGDVGPKEFHRYHLLLMQEDGVTLLGEGYRIGHGDTLEEVEDTYAEPYPYFGDFEKWPSPKGVDPKSLPAGMRSKIAQLLNLHR